MIPRSSGTVRTPSIVNVLPVPVCPYAKIVPKKKKSPESKQKIKIISKSLDLRITLVAQSGYKVQGIAYFLLASPRHIPTTILRW